MRRLLLALVALLWLPLACALPHAQYPAFAHPEARLSVAGFAFSATDGIVYRTAYVSLGGQDWQAVSLSGTPYQSSASWLSGSASLSLSSFSFPAGEESYLIVYSCTRASNAWDCHSTTSHPEGFWQLHVITTPAATTHYLVQDGVAVADIVVSPTAPNMVQLAAEYFQMYINDMTGATLPISNAPGASYDFHVYIGQSTYTDALGITSTGCENGGFKMVSGDGYLVMLGNDEPAQSYTGNAFNAAHSIGETDERGSMNAVHAFLYDQGMRWYAPVSVGMIIPEKQDIAFAQLNEMVNPDFAMRGPYIYYKKFGHLVMYHYPDFDIYLQWQLAQGFNSIEEFVTGRFVHGIDSIIDNEQTVAAHPEYYAIWNGQRMDGSNGNGIKPDLCSQGLFEANVEYVKDLIENQNATMVSVMPSDGFLYASESTPACKARETPERGGTGQISDYVFEYVNNVAWEIYEEYGVERKILCAAYTAYLLPPEHLSKPLAPNLNIILTKWRSDNADEDTKEYYEDVTDQWLELFASNNGLTGGVETNKFYTYDYYLINRWESTTESIPAYFPHIIEEDLQFLKGKSKGEFMEVYSNWPDFNLQWDSFAATALNLYLTGRLYWDADQDVDALLEEYYTLYYGPAREEMKALVEYSEAHYASARDDPTVLTALRQMANDALDAAGKETVYGKRIIEILKLINSSYEGEEVTINSCQTLDSPSTTYRLASDVSSTGSCFYIDADAVTLDCQGHTITYSTSGAQANDHGIYVIEAHPTYSDRGDYFNISRCVIRDGSYLTGQATGAAIYLSGADHGVIENTIINASGKGIENYGSIHSLYRHNIVNAYSSEAFYVQYGNYLGSDVISTNIFEGNTFSTHETNGAYLYRSNNDTLINNTFESVNGHGLHLHYNVDMTFINNTFASETTTGFSDYGSEFLVYEGNVEIDG